jgi:hypothetical protein
VCDMCDGMSWEQVRQQNGKLLVTGLDARAAQAMLALFATMVSSGRESCVPGLALLGDECSVYSLKVDQPEDVLIWAHELYGRRMSAIQLVWTDEEGRFPRAPEPAIRGSRRAFATMKGAN